MPPVNHHSSEVQGKPRVGIPWRTRDEERQRNVEKLNYYFESVRRAGGEPLHISLALSNEDLRKQAADLDAFVLPGSPADVDPARFAAPLHPKTKTLDSDRDRTDSAILITLSPHTNRFSPSATAARFSTFTRVDLCCRTFLPKGPEPLSMAKPISRPARQPKILNTRQSSPPPATCSNSLEAPTSPSIAAITSRLTARAKVCASPPAPPTESLKASSCNHLTTG